MGMAPFKIIVFFPRATLQRYQFNARVVRKSETTARPIVCGYHTGARKNELRRIWWAQVDSEAGLIRLSAGQTKGKKPRTLPIYGDMQIGRAHV